jgi:SP family general alpha glucoside:H+ symporter-like MFS transporter
MTFIITSGIPATLVCCCLVAKISSTRLRIKTVALEPNCCNIASIAANFLNNPILTGLRGKGRLVRCGFAFLSCVRAHFRLPEPKGLSAGARDVLFEQGVRLASSRPCG